MIEIDIHKRLFGSNGEMELDINITIKRGEFLALAGESGAGKTTTLRILAGLESSMGTIKVDNEIWQSNNYSLAIQKRKIGFVFQDYALFPNMSVEKNLLFVHKDIELANYLLDITNLYNLKDRLPHTLSGGQKQRVSLCRAFMKRPKLLLMDEPLSALDPFMRVKLQDEILMLHKEFGTTTFMVSHDLDEIYNLSNRLIIIRDGKIINDGDTKKLLYSQNSQKVTHFKKKIEIF